MKLEDFASKVEYEGGVIAALEYGLKSDDLDADGDPEAQKLKDGWETLDAAWEVIARLEDEAGEIIDAVLDRLDDED